MNKGIYVVHSLEDHPGPLSYTQRLDAIRAEKLKQTREKQSINGAMDFDDHSIILPPEAYREVTEGVSGSGVVVREVRFKDVPMESNHASGGFFGPELCGRNFRTVLEMHPTYVDPMSSMLGAYMVNFYLYRHPGWNPDFVDRDLQKVREKYQLIGAIGATQHFCQDMKIGLELGWDGLLERIQRYRREYPEHAGFYNGLEHVALGMQRWIEHNAEAAQEMVDVEVHPQLRQHLREMAEINQRLVHDPPHTLREACQWILWYDMAARMYNGSGSLGRLDRLLLPYYERDRNAGILTPEEAAFHIACLLARDTAYIQIGGYTEEGEDGTNEVSFLILDACEQLKVPANVGVCVGEGVDPRLLGRALEVMYRNKQGIPKFLGIDNTTDGFAKNGYPLELARQRAYSGCHWSAIPGREYTINDCVKINFGVVFDVALRDMMAHDPEPSVQKLWSRFEDHMREAVLGTARSIDFHLDHMDQVFPELMLDLCCYGPIERGLDASHPPQNGLPGGVDYYNLCVDGAALATVADSFAALEQRIEREYRLGWGDMMWYLDHNWADPGEEIAGGLPGEAARRMMKNISRFGCGGSRADEYAVEIARLFADLVHAHPTPHGYNMIPGIFSWANTISMGKNLGATPNGRYAGDPISHGANPDPGFSEDAAPTRSCLAVALVQSGYGNTAPWQCDFDPGSSEEEALAHMRTLIRTHCTEGGTQINMNVLSKEQMEEAYQDPSKYPDLVVRVTGFSAYFSSLSPEFRKMVRDRFMAQ